MSAGVIFEEAMEAVIDECQEVGHADEGLDVHPPREGQTAGDAEDGHRNGDVSIHTVDKGVALAYLSIRLKIAQR